MKQPLKNVLVDVLDPLDELEKIQGEPVEKLKIIPLADDSEKTIQIVISLKFSLKDRMIKFFQANTDVFALSASDMPSIPADMIIHKLNVDPRLKSIQQKKRCFAPKR